MCVCVVCRESSQWPGLNWTLVVHDSILWLIDHRDLGSGFEQRMVTLRYYFIFYKNVLPFRRYLIFVVMIS